MKLYIYLVQELAALGTVTLQKRNVRMKNVPNGCDQRVCRPPSLNSHGMAV